MENTKLIPWGAAEKSSWLKEQSIKRSYQDDVVVKIEKLKQF